MHLLKWFVSILSKFKDSNQSAVEYPYTQDSSIVVTLPLILYDPNLKHPCILCF